MTDTVKLNQRIQDSGLKKGHIANTLGINASTLSRKINNELDFNTREIAALCELLGISKLKEKEAIFFAM